VLGILADPEPGIAQDFAELGIRLDALVGSSLQLPPADFLVDASYVGDGYGIPSEQGNEAIRTLARREGILLDPIYSAKAFGGLCDLTKRGKISGKVLFWHTGGTPALFAMESPISP
jgi:1-aminocyclopropane-1-carboxylate deaminase/D-cysteine desulfhydrase-like pyridoxal-dependent ACC family enzyme